MNAADLAMRAWAILYQSRRCDLREARKLFEVSLRLDDGHVPSLCGLAQSLLGEVTNGAADDPAKRIQTADASTYKALALAPDSGRARLSRSMALSFLRAPQEALGECESAIALNRNHAWAHAWAGWLKILLGRAEETEAHVIEAMRLSPRDPGLGEWLLYLGFANLQMGQLERAVGRLRTAATIAPDSCVVVGGQELGSG